MDQTWRWNNKRFDGGYYCGLHIPLKSVVSLQVSGEQRRPNFPPLYATFAPYAGCLRAMKYPKRAGIQPTGVNLGRIYGAWKAIMLPKNDQNSVDSSAFTAICECGQPRNKHCALACPSPLQHIRYPRKLVQPPAVVPQIPVLKQPTNKTLLKGRLGVILKHNIVRYAVV